MVNNIEFSNRLKKVMDYYGLSATALAESIQIQRSSISHLLSGRNKPSLDFVLKVLQKYPEVELYWLLNGKGVFPKKKLDFVQKTINDITPTQNNDGKNMKSEIEKIIIFYTDGTFKSYKP